ncbi:ATPase/histidine kinase/DNA gyrase B/HSP90 domain protein [Sphingobacterium spiritivorum ATCC 33300]|uniref:histidine kinase n=1 Tax=Sphingobacterium spiritivorum ATCC 33300 TaxID=525372 RepID=C2FS73_SPHSI|nr:HAMP domain-containing sensor histidine kinase [Sphingobacterium spiritivorum]EEI94193.1 ATPase/histidine kinase/DNA gyrase B/HSP90 domain protein [Sphingobacterium spiritivorum ATCC 33300]
MVKRYKLVITVMILTGLGVILVLSGWLYGSYQNRRDLFLSSAERSMFNVIQDVYQSKINVDDSLRSAQARGRKSFVGYLQEKFPKIDFDSLRKNFEESSRKSSYMQGFRDNAPRRGEERNDEGPSQIIPPYLFKDFDFDKEVMDTVCHRLKTTLTDKGIHTDFRVELLQLSREEVSTFRANTKAQKLMWTRPTLVNPERGQFVVVKFENTWRYLLFGIGWQLLVSIVLVASLVGSFLYLMLTIFRQNKMAQLRKNFVNNMTHELKTPVSTVMAAVEAIQTYGVKDDKAKMELYLQVSRNELQHLSDMIEKVLQMDIDEVKGVNLQYTTFDIADLLERCIMIAKLNFKKKIEIVFDCEKRPVMLFADEAHLKNVCSNLLDNAIKYSGEKVLITVTLRELPQSVEVSVKDNGKGIASEYQKDVFDAFFRVPEGNLHEVKGFGLGLSYVKQMITQHGGTVSLVSELNKGSIFTISIPKA